MNIKHVLSVICTLGFISCSPQPALAAKKNTPEVETCKKVAELAGEIMRHRQYKDDFEELISAFDGALPGALFTVWAYSTLAWTTPEQKHAAIVGISEVAYKWCYNGSIPEQPKKGKYLQMGGMSLRDYFAAKVIPSVYEDSLGKPGWRDEVATESYLLADAMLKAREVAK